MKTKERILNASLKLFSEKGYDSVYLSEIADLVGIKAPSLYKHFKNKEEIFSSCVTYFMTQMESFRNELKLPGTPLSDLTYENLSRKMVLNIAKSLFEFHLTDETASSFRKLLMIERYRNEEINRIFEKIFINDALKFQTEVFKNLIEKNIFKEVTPHILALKFYSPIFLLLSKYDKKIHLIKAAEDELSEAINDFCNAYMVKKYAKKTIKNNFIILNYLYSYKFHNVLKCSKKSGRKA